MRMIMWRNGRRQRMRECRFKMLHVLLNTNYACGLQTLVIDMVRYEAPNSQRAEGSRPNHHPVQLPHPSHSYTRRTWSPSMSSVAN